MLKTVTWLLLFLAVPVAARAAGPRALSLEEAESLVRAAVAGTDLAKREFAFDPAEMPGYSDFYFLGAVVADPGAEGHAGWWAVNKFTAEVWDPYRCSRLHGVELEKLQKRIRSELATSSEDQQQHSKSDPCLAGSTP